MKVLISSRSFGKIDSGAVELLEKQGLEPIINPYGRKLNEEEILTLLDDVVGIIGMFNIMSIPFVDDQHSQFVGDIEPGRRQRIAVWSEDIDVMPF